MRCATAKPDDNVHNIEKEPPMETLHHGTTVHRFGAPNHIGAEAMPRDCTQSRRLHEPTQMLSCIDPITGRDIDDLAGRPYLVDGILTMYFESEYTRQEYLDTPMYRHLHLADNPTDEGYDEG
jgi:hypothetical protein